MGRVSEILGKKREMRGRGDDGEREMNEAREGEELKK
jgi:hypothetical protein